MRWPHFKSFTQRTPSIPSGHIYYRGGPISWVPEREFTTHAHTYAHTHTHTRAHTHTHTHAHTRTRTHQQVLEDDGEEDQEEYPQDSVEGVVRDWAVARGRHRGTEQGIKANPSHYHVQRGEERDGSVGVGRYLKKNTHTHTQNSRQQQSCKAHCQLHANCYTAMMGTGRNEPLYSREQSFGLYRGVSLSQGFFPDITTLNCDAVGTKVSGLQ